MRLAVWLLLAPIALHGLCLEPDLKPWFNETFLLEFDLGAGWCRASSCACSDPDLQVAIYQRPIWMRWQISPLPRWDLQAQIVANDTRQHHTFFDFGSVTGRFLLFSQSLGDPLEVVAGATVTIPTKQSVRDVATGHLGFVEGEVHLSAGHEILCRNVPRLRLWTTGACAFSGQGSPQLRGRLGMAYSPFRFQWLQLLFRGLYGFGRDPLILKTFDGYGRVRVRALDCCASYCIQWAGYYAATLCYSYRILSRNYPAHEHCVAFIFSMPLFP